MTSLFTHPLALLALASIPVLIAIYRLRRQVQQRMVVSSLMFWPIEKQPQEGGRTFHQFRTSRFFFLELLILLLLCIAALGPQCSSQRANSSLFLVLDDSYSMQANEPNSPRQKAIHRIMEEVRHGSFRWIRVILAQQNPQMLGGFVTSTSQMASVLQQWRCGSVGADIDKAVAFALKLADADARILVISDHAPRTSMQEGKLRWIAVGQPLANVAIVHASRSRGEGKDWCLVVLANFATQPQSIPLHVHSVPDKQRLKRVLLRLQPGEIKRLTFALPLSLSTWILSIPTDALPIDNQVFLLPTNRKPVRVKLTWKEKHWEQAVEKAVFSTQQVLRDENNPELIVTDQPILLPSNSSTWVFSIQRGIGKRKAYLGPYILQREHPLLQGISLQGVIWIRGENLLSHTPTGEQPLIMVGNIPLFSASGTFGGGWSFVLALDPLSTLMRTPNWPILFWNLVSWKQQEQPGLLEPNVRLGSNAHVRLPAQVNQVQVQSPDPVHTAFSMRVVQQRVRIKAEHPGIYRVQAGTQIYGFAVNPLSAEESNILKAGTGAWGGWKPVSSQRQLMQNWAWLFALLALVCLVWHLYMMRATKGAE